MLSEAEARVFIAARDVEASSAVAASHGTSAEILRADLSDMDQVDALVRTVQPDVTFSLAGYGVDPSETDPMMAGRLNFESVDRLGAAVSRLRPSNWEGPRVVHAGTAQEYGDAGGRLDESGPASPLTLYGRTKLEGTRALLNAATRGAYGAVVARLFTVYGPGEHAGRLLPSLISAAARREHVALTAGTQLRDFIFVRDAAEGLLRLGVSSPGAPMIVNVATGMLTSVRAFVATAAAVLDIPDEHLGFGELEVSRPEMDHAPVSTARLRSLTGWRPQTPISEGVTLTVNFLQGSS